MKSYKELIVWQKSIQLVKEIYKITKCLPKEELFVLSAQLRKSSVSIASNIAEGSVRGTRKDYAQFLRIAHGSATELETQLIIINEIYPDLGTTIGMNLITEIQKMLHALILKLNTST